MTAALRAALERGATLVTGNSRLARSLQQEFGACQLAAGRHAWATPEILPWPAFLYKLWIGQASGPPSPLLTPVQESSLWESIVETSPESHGLIQPRAAASLAADAWRLIHEWRVPLAVKKRLPAWESTAECRVFYGWAQQFQFHARWWNRLDSARQPDALLSHPLAGVGPAELWLVGFDEWTPRQREILAALERGGSALVHDKPQFETSPASLAGFASATAEAEAAAAWCRRRMEANPQARIGVVVDGLEQRGPSFERAFRFALPGAFHLSLGPPLARRPMIAAALSMLEFGGERVSWEAASSMLLSPWVAGYPGERALRAAFEIALRRWRANELSATGIARQPACPPVISRALWQGDTLRRTWTAEQTPAEWAAAFAGLLDAFGWPGTPALSSSEYQVLEAWRSSLSELASVGLAFPALTRSRALDKLRQLAGDKRFEVESTGEPVQIMGVFEAAGSRFDHLWIAGLNDETWPARPKANPFVPLSLQREFKLPHSSPARELSFASRVSKRLLQSGGEVVVSYAMADTERALAPSPLFAALPPWRGEDAAPWLSQSNPLAEAPLEVVEDASAPPVAPGAVQSGGTRALEMQAKCPFRAFAEIRLGARESDTPEPGLDPRERGGFLHTALEMFWTQFGSSRALATASQEIVEEALAQCVDAALAKRHSGVDAVAAKLLEIERRRLMELVSDWIALEKQRSVAFTVERPEQERTAQLGGLTVQVRLDRLDKLDGGSYALIDYKSRAPRLADWAGDRPESPQLPIYAVTASEPLSTVAFAQVRTGEHLFRGYSTLDGALPRVKPIEETELAERIAEWRTVLDRLGREFCAGHAEVDPKDRWDTCKQCHLSALCRVEEKKGVGQ